LLESAYRHPAHFILFGTIPEAFKQSNICRALQSFRKTPVAFGTAEAFSVPLCRHGDNRAVCRNALSSLDLFEF